MVDRTTQAAQRCADLANAVGGALYPADFDDDNTSATRKAFRRYVETQDAMIREVLALLGQHNLVDHAAACALLRADLLPDPQAPTLLEEFDKAYSNTSWAAAERYGITLALDWIAKREGKHHV